MHMLQSYTPADPFPTVVDTLLSFRHSDATSTAISEPALAASGNLLIAVISVDTGTALSTASSGWAEIADAALNNNSGRLGIYIGIKGTAAALTVSHANEHSSWGMMAVGNWSGNTANVTVTTAQLAFSADPPAHTPAAGLQNYLWLTGFSSDGGDTWATAGPSGFIGFQNVRCGSGGSGTETNLAWAYKKERVTSQNPAAFTSTGANSLGFTLSVY